MEDSRLIPVTFSISRGQHQQVASFCSEYHISVTAFYRVAAQHFLFTITNAIKQKQANLIAEIKHA